MYELKKGFEATKFNFSNMKTRKVRVYLSQDEQYICYQHLEKTLSSMVFGKTRRYPVSKIVNFFYGGLSSTFKKHAKENLKQMDVYRLADKKIQNRSDRKLERQHSLKVKQYSSKSSFSPTHSMVNNRSKISKVADHYPWECISIFREHFLSTIDLVVRDYRPLMALLHFLHQKLYNPYDSKFMWVYKRLKF